jgi:hypothetical protein
MNKVASTTTPIVAVNEKVHPAFIYVPALIF